MVGETWIQSQVAYYPKTFKMVLNIFFLNTQQYKVNINGKVEQSREKSCTLAIEKGEAWSHRVGADGFTSQTA